MEVANRFNFLIMNYGNKLREDSFVRDVVKGKRIPNALVKSQSGCLKAVLRNKKCVKIVTGKSRTRNLGVEWRGKSRINFWP
jgi:hypothetical protein